MTNDPSRRSQPRQEEAELEDVYRELSELDDDTNYKESDEEESDEDEFEEEEYEEEPTLWDRLNSLLHNNRLLVIIAICTAVLVIAIGIAVGIMLLPSGESEGQILQNITIAGVDVGGMTTTEAINAVRLATNQTYSRQSMTVRVLEKSIQISPSVSKITLDVEGAVDAAYSYGRTGSKHKQAEEQKTAATVGYAVDLTKYLDLDADAVKSALDALGKEYSTTLKQTTYEITGTKPSLKPSDTVNIQPQHLVITMGTPEYSLDMDALYKQIFTAYSQNVFSVEGECSYVEPDPLDLDAIYQDTYIEPVDAMLNPETYTVDEGTCGYEFDLESAKQQLADLDYGQTLDIPFVRIPPKVTGENISSTLYRDVLSSCTVSDDSDPVTNQRLAAICNKLDGVIINPESVFSYNQAVGNAAVEGLFNVSSALYRCAIEADLDIVVRSGDTYYTATYVNVGLDAAVGGNRDLRFRNNTKYPIRIEAMASGGRVTVTFIGTDEKDYYVQVEFTITSIDNYSTSIQVMSPDNAEGYKDGDLIVSPYTGYVVETFRCMYNKQTGALQDQILEDITEYQRRDGVVCEIKQPDAELPTVPPPPLETE